MKKTILAADLFCGAGGTSTGLMLACEELDLKLKLVAVNHWDKAIETHSKNHPNAKHLLTSLDSIDPRKVVPRGKLDLLVASPECLHHSNARGGKPMNDQSRASAFMVLRWLEALQVNHVLIENVPEFLSWGPLGTNNRPLKKKRGELFRTFIAMLEALNYRVEWKKLICADYGDPTTRVRLFVQAKKTRGPIIWPEITHVAKPSKTLFGQTERYRPARDCINFDLPSQSIFTRKIPLRPNTISRIIAGLIKFSGLPFTMSAGGPKLAPSSIEEPLRTVLTRDHQAIVEPEIHCTHGDYRGTVQAEPFVLNAGGPTGSQRQPRSVLTDDHHALVESFIVELHKGQNARSIDEPLSAISTSGAHHALIESFIVELRNHCAARSLDDPLSSLCAGGTHFGLAEPFVVDLRNTGSKKRKNGKQNGAFVLGQQSGSVPRSVEDPLPTIAGGGAIALCEPCLIPVNHGKDDRCYSVDQPMPTVTSIDAWGVVEPRPYLIKYNGTGQAYSIDEPLDTVSTRDRFALVIPQMGIAIDIKFRMLQPEELAAAMSFPKKYFFAGKRREKVKQIGNAVPIRTAKALCQTILAPVAGRSIGGYISTTAA